MEKKIVVVMLGVKDMKRAVRFYKDILRLPLKFEAPEFSEFKTAGSVLALELRKKTAPAGGPEFVFQSKNIKKDFAHLKRHKVKFYKPLTETSYGWLLMPYDSEGNIFEVVEYKN